MRIEASLDLSKAAVPTWPPSTRNIGGLALVRREAGDPSDNGAEVKREIERGLRKVGQGAILVQEVAHVGYQHTGEATSAQVA